MDDKSIVELYWNRSEKAISETDKKYGKYCFSIAHGILQSREDAEESVNDTYNEAWNSIPPHSPSVLSTFLGKITRRISIDKYRRTHAEKRGGGEMPLVLEELGECISGVGNTERAYDSIRLTEIINDFVVSLPKTERKVFVCRYWYMDSVVDISKKLHFSESKVKSMLHRTRARLKEILVKEGFLNEQL